MNGAAYIVRRPPGPASAMAWGAPRGVDDLCARLAANDPGLTSLTLLPGRRVGPPEWEQLSAALRSNAALTELTSSHALTPASAAVLAAAVAAHVGLRRLAVGNSALGDEGLHALAPALSKLAGLDLEHKGVSSAAVGVLTPTLTHETSTLEDLNISRNALGCVRRLDGREKRPGGHRRNCSRLSSDATAFLVSVSLRPCHPLVDVTHPGTTAPPCCAPRWAPVAG